MGQPELNGLLTNAENAVFLSVPLLSAYCATSHTVAGQCRVTYFRTLFNFICHGCLN